MVQSMADVSPTRWHIAHTTWFFETFLLKPSGGYREFDPQFNYLFNSYYNQVGKQFPRPQRGLISRPGLSEIKRYRQHVDCAMDSLFDGGDIDSERAAVIEIGLNHEQQHQELILTDIKHVLSCNPMLPCYQDTEFDTCGAEQTGWRSLKEGQYEIGFAGDGFCFDNELPRHTVYLHRCQLSRDLVTCGQYVEFINDGGYLRPDHWLSMGWAAVQQNQWESPLYWVQQGGNWKMFTLAGLQDMNPAWPVCHISYFEADAFARWAGHRLPTEFEWEIGCQQIGDDNQRSQVDEPFADYLLDRGLAVHPTRSPAGFQGGVWQWTSGSYGPYPGYRPPAGAIGEYNGKFMCNQYVLRGGSVATSQDHIRSTYRNFFPADARWQFSGIRLAR
jgi:ergothioneine biosynthesis protein EgtB